ncbi:hypothetical protein [Streptomyces canus]|uniref:hypothetical protein n=1 Tax=Streptomyces canus TaxID=58343 RepID=UPI00324D690C
MSLTTAAIAAAGIHAVDLRLHGRAVAAVPPLLWGLLPRSVVLSPTYTQLTAFAPSSLYAVPTG